MLSVARGSIKEGVIKKAEDISDSIQQLFSENNFKTQNVAISIGGYSVIVKKINVRKMSEEQLQETINFEAEQYIPFNISDVNLDYQILGANKNNPEYMELLLVAVKKKIVEDYVNLIQMSGLNPCIIDIDTFALQNIFELNYGSGNTSIALIDTGACKTSLNIIKNSSSVFMRDIGLGCHTINEKIISLVGCSYEKAEDLKYGMDEKKLSSDILQEINSSVINEWCVEIRRALDFFYSAYPDEPIKKIVLSGGGANIKEFSEALAVETSSEVELINPFINVQANKKKFDSSYLKKISLQAAISMGLAIRKVDDK
jgi:type IV pilus assembly protein PilM